MSMKNKQDYRTYYAHLQWCLIQYTCSICMGNTPLKTVDPDQIDSTEAVWLLSVLFTRDLDLFILMSLDFSWYTGKIVTKNSR
jgi:hypothetical protein